MKEEIPTQKVTVSEAEPWMDKPIKVELKMQITDRLSNSQTFYLNEEESEDLIRKLSAFTNKFTEEN